MDSGALVQGLGQSPEEFAIHEAGHALMFGALEVGPSLAPSSQMRSSSRPSCPTVL